jgi:quercetin dioxygenase-like cupin family protein
MARVALLLSLVVVLLLSGGTGLLRSSALAQDATPAAGEMDMGGLSFTLLGVALGAPLPSTGDLQVARVGFAPGAGFPFDPSDPTAVIVIMESGELTAHVAEQAWTISRGAALQEAMAAAAMEPDLSGVLDEVAMGEETTLRAGDVAYVPSSISGEVRNDGEEDATALVITIAPSGTPVDGEATEATPAP